MTTPAQQMQQGLAALRDGNATEARSLFETALSDGSTDPAAWLALGFACANSGDAPAALQAVEQALDIDPRNLRGLLFKADVLEKTGQARIALNFYTGALQEASRLGQVPQDVQQGLARAENCVQRFQQEYREFLLAAMRDRGFSHGSDTRFQESMDIVLGDKLLHTQQPTRYCFPGLTQQAFFPREQFPWLDAVEAQTDAIRDELQAVLAEGDHFSPYLEVDKRGPEFNDRSNLGSMDWSACYLWREGEPVAAMQARCPRTVEALSGAPLCQIPGQMPSVLFSRLAPGATIAPHHGVVNTRLICHLPLIVPPDCGALRVGNYERSWEEGKALVFDDSIEHAAWNNSRQERVVLLFDIWRPELSEDERHWVSQLLQAVSDYDDRQVK